MTAARVILGLIMAGTAVSNLLVWHWGWQESQLAFVWFMISAMLFTAAVAVMAITFVNFQQKDGKFILDSNSWIARICGWNYGDKITICSLFWTTVLLITMSIVGFVALLTALLAATEVGWAQTLKVILAVVATMTAIGLLVWGMVSAEEYVDIKKCESLKIRRVVDVVQNYIFPVIALIVLLAVLGLVIYDIGAWKFLRGVGIIVAVIAGGVGLVFGTIATFKSVRESAVGKILVSGWYHVKFRTCPVVSVMDLK